MCESTSELGEILADLLAEGTPNCEFCGATIPDPQPRNVGAVPYGDGWNEPRDYEPVLICDSCEEKERMGPSDADYDNYRETAFREV